MRRLLLVLIPTLAAANPRWSEVSADEMSSDDAVAFCAKRGADWRLPTKAELVKVTGVPDDGFLWSGEDVNAERVGQRWIMNLANRHIFNGSGRTGLAKCVKAPLPKKVELKLGPAYALIGKPSAKLTVVVAVQHDFPWWKIRPTIDKLIAEHSVRFDLRPYIVFEEKYGPSGLAVCAAAKAGKLVALEGKLQDLKPNAPNDALDAAAMRAMAVDAGIDGKQYDRHLKTCAKIVPADKEALSQRVVESVPTFWINDKKVVGAKPDELIAAVEAALGGNAKP